MKVGLIGKSGTGKSTLYRAASLGKAKGDVTAVPVPDARFNRIVEQVKPKKITPATVILHDDIEAIGQGNAMFSHRFLEAARKMDLLVHVVRAFDSAFGAPQPAQDQQGVDVELVLSDLQIVENRLERLAKSPNAKSPGHTDYLEKRLFEEIHDPLEAGTAIRAMSLSEEDQIICKNHLFLSAKPLVAVFNVSESEASSPSAEVAGAMAGLAKQGAQAFAVCATLEEEVSQLDPADQPEFLGALGLSEPASNRLVRAVYDALGLLTFYTAGENETRAWALRKGGSALEAAATIHTEIAQGFIRAEVVHYPDYDAAGSLDAAYAANKMHLVSKDHAIEDGDLIHIRTSR